jgi:hypothetical protein
MSEKLLQDKYHPIESKSGAATRVMKLFWEVEKHHGTDEARRIFERWARHPTQAEINKLKGWKLIERYDDMDDQNVRELARQIEAANAKLPNDQQLTPRPRPTRETIEAYLRELLRQRRDGIKDGTWDGPGHDPFASARAMLLKDPEDDL